MKKKILVSIYILSLILCLTACSKNDRSSSQQSTSNSASKAEFVADSVAPKNSDLNLRSGGNSTENGTNDVIVKGEAPKIADARKIVKNYSIGLQTLEFDNAITIISNKCTEIGGYVEISNISGSNISDANNVTNRSASLKLRIPKEQYSNFKAIFKGLGSITNQQETGENITQQYFDTDAHLTSLKIQEERLLELLKKSGDLKSILDIEKELQTVRYSIESLTTSLKKMDNLVDYTTFSISINEVQEIKTPTLKPVSLIDKISDGFKGSVDLLVTLFKGLLVLIASLLPFAVIILIAYPIVLYIHKSIKKSSAKIIETSMEDKKEKGK